jgi:hypothetical protein
MAGCRNSVNSICDELNKILWLAIPCLPKTPPVLIALGANARKGLNKKIIAARIIARFPEVGIPNGADEAGNQNVMEAYTALVVEELIDAIVFEAIVETESRPYSIPMLANGGNAGGPITVIGFNTTFVQSGGIVK